MEDELKKLQLVEEANVKKYTEEEINRLYADGTIEKKYEPIKTVYKQSKDQPSIRKKVYEDKKVVAAAPKIEVPQPEKISWKPKEATPASLSEETITTTTTKHIIKDEKGRIVKEETSAPVIHQTKEKRDVNLVESILAPEDQGISKGTFDDSQWKADQTEGGEGGKRT
jgi:hypothetical protein